jgi:hypothetical protein
VHWQPDFFKMNTPLFRIDLEDDLLRVQAFFNVYPDCEFLQAMSGLLTGKQLVYNDVGCILPRGEEWAPKTGALFFVRDEQVHITNEEFYKFLKMAIESFLTKHENEKEHAFKVLERAKKFLI